jgi:hypothetical protein
MRQVDSNIIPEAFDSIFAYIKLKILTYQNSLNKPNKTKFNDSKITFLQLLKTAKNRRYYRKVSLMGSN